ncbi:MAG: cytochrome C [Pseudomonadota bacterium]
MTKQFAMPLLGCLLAALTATATAAGKSDVAPVNDELYAKECGACHFAYPPGLLPARSWEKLFSQLSEHFGENAELAADDVKALTTYAAANAADRSTHPRSQKIARSVKAGDTPLRITETPYIRGEHRELPRKILQDNPQVQSLGKCNACHTHAAQGSFNEDEIKIPGFDRWEN